MAHKICNFDFFSHFRYFVPGVVDFIILAILFGVGILLGAAAMMFFDIGNDISFPMAVSYPLMFIPAMIYASSRSRADSYRREGVKMDNWNVSGIIAPVAVAVAATLAGSFCCDAASALMPQMPDYLKETLKQMTSGNIWMNLLCVGIFAPFFEEWLCRGTVLRGLLGRGVKPVWAIPISAAVFALIHGNIWQALPAFALGLLFGYVYYRTGSLKLTMLMHCTNNCLALAVSRVDSLSQADNWMQIIPTRWYWLIFACCAVIIALSLMFFRKNGSDKALESVPPLFTE